MRTSRAGTDCPPRDDVRQELRNARRYSQHVRRWRGPDRQANLRGNGIEQLACNGDARVCQLGEKRAGDAEALVDVESAIDLGVVDQALPPDRRTGLFSQRSGLRVTASAQPTQR